VVGERVEKGVGGTRGEKRRGTDLSSTRNFFLTRPEICRGPSGKCRRRRRYAVFQLISSERKNDAVIATAICSGHKSRACAYYGRVDIEIYIPCAVKRIPSCFCVFTFFSRFIPRSNQEAIIAITSLKAGNFYRRAQIRKYALGAGFKFR